MFHLKAAIYWFVLVAFGGLSACTQLPPQPTYPPPEGSLSMHGGWKSEYPILGMDTLGNPTVLWQEWWILCRYAQGGLPVCNRKERELHVKNWDAQAWNHKQIKMRNTTDMSFQLDYCLSKDNIPFAYGFEESSDQTLKLRVMRWTAETWVRVYEGLDIDRSSGITAPVRFLLDSRDFPVVGWNTSAQVESATSQRITKLLVYRWDGTTWAQIGQAVEQIQAEDKELRDFSIALDSRDNPVVAFVSRQMSPDLESNFSYLRLKRWTGTEWAALGGQLNDSDFACAPQVQVDAQDNPVVAFFSSNHYEWYTNQIQVKRWNKQNWVGLGNIGPNAWHDSISMGLDSRDNPIITFPESTFSAEPTQTIFVVRWNGSAWTQFKTIHKKTDAQRIHTPQLAVTTNDMVVVYLQTYPLGYAYPIYGEDPQYLFAEILAL